MPESSKLNPLVRGLAARVLGAVCHSIHIGLVVFVLVGWAIPLQSVRIAHLIFVPLLIVIWVMNRNSCPLNNLESFLTKGVWRDPDNREEGSFLLVLVERHLKVTPSQRQMDIVTYALMAFAWLMSCALSV